MIKLGKMQKLKIKNISEKGAYLDSGAGKSKNNIFIKKTQLPENATEGDTLEVFVYKGDRDKLVATTKKPLAEVGKLAHLRVVETTKIGAFLDMGLDKDLLLPFREQRYSVQEGRKYLVAVYIDKTGRLCATTDIYDHLRSDSPYKKGDRVEGTVYRVKRDLGALVAVDNKYKGLIPKGEYFSNIRNGDKVNTRVIRVREDGKLDLSPRNKAYKQMDIDAEKLIKRLEKSGGFLPINDKSRPMEIKSMMNMSKSAFKRAVGRLLKMNMIEQTKEGIRFKK